MLTIDVNKNKSLIVRSDDGNAENAIVPDALAAAGLTALEQEWNTVDLDEDSGDLIFDVSAEDAEKFLTALADWEDEGIAEVAYAAKMKRAQP